MNTRDRVRHLREQARALPHVIHGAVTRTTNDWGPLAARARGLLSGVHTPEEYGAHPERSLYDLVELLVTNGAVPPGTPADPVAIDLAITRQAAARLTTIARWGALTHVPVDGVIAAHEIGMIRTLLRGAASHEASAWRLATLVPTPALPRRLLERAATLDIPLRVLALLVAAGHFAGAPALAAWREAPSSSALRRAEHAMAVAWGARFASTSAPRGADEPLRDWLRDEAWLLTLWNALAALDEPLEDALTEPVPGAEALPASLCRVAARHGSDGREALRTVLEPYRAQSAAFAAALDAEPGHEERAARAAQRPRYAAWARREPLSSAPVLYTVLAVQAERAAVSAAAFAARVAG